MIIRGTVRELELIVSWIELCEIIGVDYYKRSWIGEDEVFTIERDPVTRQYKKISSEVVAPPEKRVLVGYQQRFIDDEEGPTIWSFCDSQEAMVFNRRSHFQVRPVYAVDFLD